MLCNQEVDDRSEIGVAGAKATRKKVAATCGDGLAVGEHVELSGLTRRDDSVDAQALLDEGHETRDLGAVVLSRRAMNDFDFHSAPI